MKIVNRTRGRRYTIISFIFNSFSDANVLDMPVTAVIFATEQMYSKFLKCLNMPKVIKLKTQKDNLWRKCSATQNYEVVTNHWTGILD